MKRVVQIDQKFLKTEIRKRRGEEVWWKLAVVIGVISGLILLACGLKQNLNDEVAKLTIRSEAEVRSEIEEAERAVTKLNQEMNQEYGANAKSPRFYQLKSDLAVKEGRLMDLNAELWRLEQGFYDQLKRESMSRNLPMMMAGVFVLITTLMLGSLKWRRKSRNILHDTVK